MGKKYRPNTYEVSIVVEFKIFKKVRASNDEQAKRIAFKRQKAKNDTLEQHGYIATDLEVVDAVLIKEPLTNGHIPYLRFSK